MENEEKLAYLHGIECAVEYTDEIKKTNLADMTPEEVLTFAECMCKNYHQKIMQINVQND